MPKKKTLDEVKEYINEISDGKAIVLSDEYVNSKTPLKLQCGCGEIFYRSYGKIKSGNSCLCKNCMSEHKANIFKTDFNDILKTIQEHGCEYVSGEYKNNNSKLLLKCSCGNLFYKPMNKFITGQNHCPECGMKNLVLSKTKYDFQSAQNILATKGYKIIDNDFINAATPVLCECKRGHKCNIILSQFLNGRSGCSKCANMDNSGSNHFNFNNWSTTIREELRTLVNPWKKHIRELYDYTCPITNIKNNGDVHHLTSLNSLYYKKIYDYNLDIPLKNKVNSFGDKLYIFENIKNEILMEHTDALGIYIDKSIHIKFHRIYGSSTNPDQFNEFLQKYYSLTLDDIQKKG